MSEVRTIAEIIGVDLFTLGATALAETPHLDGGVDLVAGFESEVDARRASTVLGDRHGSHVQATTITSHEPDWTQSQRDGLHPTRIGPWSIRAPWHAVPDELDTLHDIVIDPGAAFGHGAHPTTVMAIELLWRHGRPGHHLVDVGTGTAVIAIIAARSAMTVDAIESDRAAIEIARQNIEANTTTDHPETASRITLYEGDAAEAATIDPTALVVANVTLDVQRELAPTLAVASIVLLSGLLCRQVAEAAGLYPDHELTTIRTHGEWASLELRRRRRLIVAENG